MMITKSFFLAVLAIANSVIGDIFVSPNGNDSNGGTEESPLRTLEAAQSAVRDINQNMESDIKVLVETGTYRLTDPIIFTSADSGSNGYSVVWEAGDVQRGANISGGVPVTDWALHDEEKNIYSAKVEAASPSRHLFVNQKHAPRARRSLERSWLKNETDGYRIVDVQADFISNLSKIDQAEIIGVNSFTHRITPIASATGGDTLLMKQPAFSNNGIGYDTMSDPGSDFGFYVENSLDILDEDNEWYFDTESETIYYKPSSGQSIDELDIVFAQLEKLLILEGSYDDPVHDLTFRGFNYMHTTWNFPSSDLGYVDQQTGGFIGLNKTYPQSFEASRPEWWQIPGSVQVSAAHDITFQNGSAVALMGGFGIGNDPNAHSSQIGLGTSRIKISGMNFFQIGANAITLGGIQQDAHHPSDPRMELQENKIVENIFKEVAATITSCVPILVTYTLGTEIIHNDISDVPYSGIAWGYGWGANDAGGNPEYMKRGLYDYQPVFDTPTTMADGYIAKNLIHNYGLSHNDLGGIYTLSKSPNTSITENWIIYNGPGMGALYHDEGSRDYVSTDSVVEALNADWLWRNQRQGYTTGNLTIRDFAVNQQPIDGDNEFGDRISDVSQWATYDDLSQEQKAWVFNAGIPPNQRGSRPVSKNQEALS